MKILKDIFENTDITYLNKLIISFNEELKRLEILYSIDGILHCKMIELNTYINIFRRQKMKVIKNYKLNYYNIDVVEVHGETIHYNLMFKSNIIGFLDGNKKEIKNWYSLMKDYTLKECLNILDECLNLEKQGNCISMNYYSGNFGIIIDNNDEQFNIIKCIKHF